ncbi:DUF6504 family protein, partial [Chloroflexota bacterium]
SDKNLLTIELMFYYNIILFLILELTVSKLIGEPIKVHQAKDSMVTAFIWRKRLYKVHEVISWWREPADWWIGKATRLFVRVNATNSSMGTYELYKMGEEWFLSRVLD